MNITEPIKNRVNSQVTFSKETNKKITMQAAKLGITRSKLINATMTKALSVTKKTAKK